MAKGSLTFSANNPRDTVLPYGIFLWSNKFPTIIDYFTKNPDLLEGVQSGIQILMVLVVAILI